METKELVETDWEQYVRMKGKVSALSMVFEAWDHIVAGAGGLSI